MGYNGTEKSAVEDLMVQLCIHTRPETFREVSAEYLSTVKTTQGTGLSNMSSAN